MYYKIKFKTACKIIMEDIFSSEKKTVEFIANQVVTGRVDTISTKTILVLEDGYGGPINKDLIEKVG